MAKKPDAQAFLAALQGPEEVDEPRQPKPAAAAPAAQPTAELHQLPSTPKPAKGRGKGSAAKPSRAELKHFGGYVDDETLEKIALLRVRLKKDNSELITFAIDELHRKQSAKRAFGDA